MKTPFSNSLAAIDLTVAIGFLIFLAVFVASVLNYEMLPAIPEVPEIELEVAPVYESIIERKNLKEKAFNSLTQSPATQDPNIVGGE